MSKKKHLSLRFTSALLCMTILTGGMAANWTPIRDIPVSAKTLAELQEERKSNEKKIAEKQKELDSLQSDLEEQSGHRFTGTGSHCSVYRRNHTGNFTGRR